MSKIFFNALSGNIDMAPDISSKNFFIDKWFNDALANSPSEIVEYGQKVFSFDVGLDQVMSGVIKVMADYIAGQMYARFAIYTPSLVGKSQWELTASLKKIGSNGALDVSQAFTSLLTDMNSATANKYYKIEIPITDTNGKINNVLISADDIIEISIKRLSIVDDVDDMIRLVQRVEVYKS